MSPMIYRNGEGHRFNSPTIWRAVVVVTLLLASAAMLLSAILWSRNADNIAKNCEAIDNTRAPLVVILKRSRHIADKQGELDAKARDFYRDSIASLAPLDCG